MNAIDAIKEALESLEYDADWEAKKDYGVRSAMSILRQALADTGIDRGAWADVPDATKWVDELRGEEWTPDDMSYRPNGLSLEEPVGHIVEAHGLIGVSIPEMPPVGTRLYVAPPKREWVGLTNDEIEKEHYFPFDYRRFARAIEAKLKEKNSAS